MSIARIHHYVPRTYLRGFARGAGKSSQLLAIDVVDRRSFWTSPKNVCAERDFNRIDIPGHPPDVLEKQLARFDSLLGAALQKIAQMRSFEDQTARLMLLNFASAVATRNPDLRASMEDFYRQIEAITGELLVSTPQRYEAALARARKDGDVRENLEVSYEQMRAFVRERRYELEFPPGFHIEREMKVQDKVLRTMLDRKWTLLRAPRGAEFVTSDRPVCLWANERWEHPLGYGLSNTTVVLPVNSSLLAMGTFEGREGVFDAPREYVASMNLAVALRCDRLVFARSASFETTDVNGTITVGPDLIHRLIASERRPRAPKQNASAGERAADSESPGGKGVE